MDPRSFDAFARGLAAPRTRRHALRVLVGGVAAAFVASRRPEAADAVPMCYPRCDSQACEYCEYGTCVYRCRDTQICQAGRCVAPPPPTCNPACPPTHDCQAGTCVPRPLPCDPRCGWGEVCENGSCVCDGPVCGIPGHGGAGCCPGGQCNGDACCYDYGEYMECSIP